MVLHIKPLSPKIGTTLPLPRYATAGSAGLDLCACIDAPLTIPPGGRVSVAAGIAIALPDAGYGAFLFARSSLGTRHGVALANGVGVIDSDYRGEITVPLINQSDVPYTVEPGDRIAQLVVLPVVQAELRMTDTLDDTARGIGGFGSTGR